MTASLLDSPEPAPEWTLADLFAVLVRRRAWLLGSVALCSALALLYGLAATRRYRATAEIEIQKESRGAFGLDNTTTDKPVNAVADSFDLNLTLQTETSILESDSLALDVIRRTGLETTPDYFAPAPGHLAWRHSPLLWRIPLEPLSVPLAQAPNRRYAALKIFARHLKITQLPGTRLIRIAYSDPDPARAAAVVNGLIQAFSDYNFHSRSSSAAQSASWLATQLAGLKQQTESLDARAAALQNATGSYGDDPSHNVVLARLDELNAQLAAAQSGRIVREAVWRAVQSGDPEALSSLAGNASGGSSTQNSWALLQSLRAQETTAKAQLAESANRYGDNWPAVAEQRARLATIQRSIQDEIRRLGDRARSDYEIALQSENAARQAFNQQKDLAARITGSAAAARLLRQEADESRALYTTLLGRLQQAGVLEGLHSGNFTILSPARIPPPGHPTSPNLPLLAAVALAAGLTTGSAAALFRELTDNAIHTPADLESLLEVPVFTALPTRQPTRPWYRRLLPAPASVALALDAAAASDFAIPAPESPYVDALHRLRASLLLARSSQPPRIITIVPAQPTPLSRPASLPASSPNPYLEPTQPSLALNLAAILAQHGSPVLYVDADLRSAPPAGVFPADPGLSDVLASSADPAYDHPSPWPPLLSVLHTGPRPPCPSELIASPRMADLLARWRQEFQFIVINSPAVAYADALVLAQSSDAVLLTAQAGKSQRGETLSAFHTLSRQIPDHAVLGLIFEDAPTGARYV